MKWRTSSSRSVGQGRLRSGRGLANSNKRARKLSIEECRAVEARLRSDGILPPAQLKKGDPNNAMGT
jgi:hypothetical protein